MRRSGPPVADGVGTALVPAVVRPPRRTACPGRQPIDLGHPARQLGHRGRPVARVTPSSSAASNGSSPARSPLIRLISQSVGANSLARGSSVIRRCPRTARSTMVARDVDRVDPLVGHRADVTRPDVADDPELALPRSGRHELADPGHRATGGARRRRPDDAAGTGRCRRAPAVRGPAPAAAAGRERPADRPEVVDLLVAGHRARREADVDLDDLALAARTVAEGRDLAAAPSRPAGTCTASWCWGCRRCT